MALFGLWSVWAAARAAAGRAARGLWARAPSDARWRLVDGVASARAALWRLWLGLAALATVRADPFGCARRPIRVAAGRPGAVEAAVCFVGGRTARELRVATHFWRSHPEADRPAFSALAARHGVPGGRFCLSGVVVPPAGRGAPALPLAFRVSLDLGAGTVAIAHARAAASGAGGPECVHAPAPIMMNAVGLDDVLRPLLRPPLCAALASG